MKLYLLFTVTASVAAGVGAYVLIRDHKPSEADASEDVPHVVAAPKPVHHETEAMPKADPEAAAEAEPPTPPPPAERSLADERAVDPMLDPNSDVSPVLGLPGIDGAIDRSSVDRRFKARAPLMQRCWERSGANPGRVRITLSVAANGHIDQVKVADGMNGAFETCTTSLLSTMSFSGTRDGHPATVVQPIAFQ